MEEFKDLEAKVEGEGEKPREIMPTVRDCYRHGWRQLWKYFATLLLISVVFIITLLPNNIPIIGIIYWILVVWPLEWGLYFVFLKIARGEELKVKDLFYAFKNYGNVLLGFLLTGVIILLGFIFLIIPGIYLVCKLAFVPYLVVDRRMGAITAIRTSWRMTRGYAMKVFLIWLLGVPVALAGVICLIVGVIPALMWIGIAYATLYDVVSKRSEVSNMSTSAWKEKDNNLSCQSYSNF